MNGKIIVLLGVIVGLAWTGQAEAQFNPARATNAPMETKFYEFEDDNGDMQRKKVMVKPKADGWGNARGSKYDLAIDGAFKGQTIAVMHLYTGEGFDFSLPKEALSRKGFSVYRWVGAAPSPKALKEALDKSCQFWLISDARRHLNAEHLKIIKEFWESGRGVYIWGDNEPFYSDANYVATGLFGGTMLGNLPGNKTVTVRKGKTPVGLMPNHDVTTGLEHLYEGITIATLQPNDALDPLLYGSAGNLVAAIYANKGRRAILDGGFTRLYINWDTAGTARYVMNAAAWLTNYERFGDEVVAAPYRTGAASGGQGAEEVITPGGLRGDSGRR